MSCGNAKDEPDNRGANPVRPMRPPQSQRGKVPTRVERRAGAFSPLCLCEGRSSRGIEKEEREGLALNL
jgi:hypothetical protein